MTAWLSEVLKLMLGQSAVQHSLSVQGQVCCQDPAALPGLILDRIFLTSAGDSLVFGCDFCVNFAAWLLVGVGSFCAGVSFCISNREKYFRTVAQNTFFRQQVGSVY